MAASGAAFQCENPRFQTGQPPNTSNSWKQFSASFRHRYQYVFTCLTSSPVWHVTSIYMNHTFLIYWCGWTWFFSHRNKTHNSCVPKNRPCYTATQPGSGQNEQKYLDLLRRHSESLLATQRADMHNYIYTHYIYIYIRNIKIYYIYNIIYNIVLYFVLYIIIYFL